MSLLYQSLILGSSPLAYYRLGESSGTTASDTSGNGYNGTYSASGVTYAQTGVVVGDSNTAVKFDGTAGYVALPSGLHVGGLTALSVEAWVNLTSINAGTYPHIVAADEPDSSNNGMMLFLDASVKAITFQVGNGTTALNCYEYTTLTTGTWYHLVGTYDGANIRIYFNGVLANTVALAGSIGTPSTAMTIARSSTGAGAYFPGIIDEVAIYNSVLSGATILNHYNTARQADTSLYTVSNGADIFTTDSNQIIKVLQQISGGQEKGGYVLGGNGYTSSTNIGMYVGSLSRNATPVSVSIDTTDQAPPGSMGAPFTANLAMGGFQVGANYTAANTSNTCAGKYTIQY